MCIRDRYYTTGQFDEAISSLRKAIEINPNYAKSYRTLGLAFGKKGDLKLKELYIEKAYEIDPTLKFR